MYYLNSRYYEPEIGRFINADGYVSTGQGLSGYNMFTYCGNNPIRNADPSGKFFKSVGSAIHAAVGNLLKKIANQVVQNTVTAVKFAIDIKNFDLANTDEEKVIDANYFSAYKGHIAIKHPFKNVGSLSFYGTMIIANDANKNATHSNPYTNYAISTVRHEYGHCKQYESVGPIKYTTFVFLPSILGYFLGVPYNDYFSLPWEYEADLLGGVQRDDVTYSDQADEALASYKFITSLW